MKRRKEAETLLESQKKLLEWERRLDEEENRVKNLLNEALSLKTTRRKDSVTSEEGDHPGMETVRCAVMRRAVPCRDVT